MNEKKKDIIVCSNVYCLYHNKLDLNGCYELYNKDVSTCVVRKRFVKMKKNIKAVFDITKVIAQL